MLFDEGSPPKNIAKVFLSRRNLLILLAKLDRKAAGGDTACTIIKRDNEHPVYPQTMKQIQVTAVEDAEYYAHRDAGWMHPTDEATIAIEKASDDSSRTNSTSDSDSNSGA